MAVTKIWAIKDSLQRVLDYAANPDKTEYDALAQTLHYAENDAKTKLNESAQLVTGIHCRADHVWEDMRAVQERFGKTDGVVALHAYQSFREGEVTPEQCHEIGVALARKVWGKRFQVLVATHMNTDNLHNHFVINSVSYVDGKKYEQRRSQYAEFRAASDKLCREYGLSVVEQPKAKEPARYARIFAFYWAVRYYWSYKHRILVDVCRTIHTTGAPLQQPCRRKDAGHTTGNGFGTRETGIIPKLILGKHRYGRLDSYRGHQH